MNASSRDRSLRSQLESEYETLVRQTDSQLARVLKRAAALLSIRFELVRARDLVSRKTDEVQP